MKKVIIAFVLIVSTFAISLFGACSVFDKIDDAFNDILGEVESEVESKEEPSNPSSEKESEVESVLESEVESEKPVDAPDVMSFTYGGVTYSSASIIKVKNGSYSFKINLAREDGGEVGEVYGTTYAYTLKASGRYNAVKKTINNGTVTEEKEGVVNLSEQTFNGVKDDLLSAKYMAGVQISDGYLTVNYFNGIKYLPAAAVRTGIRYDFSSPYVDGRSGGVADKILLDIYVEDVASGLSGLIILELI